LDLFFIKNLKKIAKMRLLEFLWSIQTLVCSILISR
jgi:hypothetical protein